MYDEDTRTIVEISIDDYISTQTSTSTRSLACRPSRISPRILAHAKRLEHEAIERDELLTVLLATTSHNGDAREKDQVLVPMSSLRVWSASYR